MEVNVIIRGTPEQCRQAMRELLNEPSRPEVVKMEVTDDASKPEPEIIPPAPKPRTRKPKATEPATIEGDVNKTEAPTDATETEPKEVSESYLVAAIKAFIKARGENDTWALFTKYGAKNRSTLLSSGKAAEAIAEIEAAVGVEAIKAEMAE